MAGIGEEGLGDLARSQLAMAQTDPRLARGKGAMVADYWAAIEEAERVRQLGIFGLHELTGAVAHTETELGRRHTDPGLSADEQATFQARWEQAEWAKAEIANDYTGLNAQALISMNSALDAVVEDLVRAIQLTSAVSHAFRTAESDVPEASEQLGLQGHALVEDAARPVIARELRKRSKGLRGSGAARYESLLAEIGLSAPDDRPIPADFDQALTELGALRDVLVHRAGRVDDRALEQAPSLRYREGQFVRITSAEFRMYSAAIACYAHEIWFRIIRSWPEVSESDGPNLANWRDYRRIGPDAPAAATGRTCSADPDPRLLPMEAGSAERDALLGQQIKVMSPDRFEQLIFELAKLEEPTVQRLVPPDGGADTVRPATDQASARVWQAKRYAGQINWPECEKSLNRAIKRWSPESVVFAFARDFSERPAKSFQARLVDRGANDDVAVEAWTLSEIVRRLSTETGKALRIRFFELSQQALMEMVERLGQVGGPLNSLEDLLQRAQALGDFTGEADPDFRYATSSVELTAPAPDWSELPYMTLDVAGERSRVHVASWPREGAEVEQPSFSFTDDETGRQARKLAVRSLARGEEAVIADGVTLRFQAPALMKDLIDQDGQLPAGQIRLGPGEPIEVEVELNSPILSLQNSIGLRPVPAPTGSAASFAGLLGPVLIEIHFELLEEPMMRAHVSFDGTFGPEAATNIDVAEMLLAFDSHERMTIRSDVLFPQAGELGGRFSGDGLAPQMRESVEARLALNREIVEIEKRSGRQLAIPEDLGVDDLATVSLIAEVIRSGAGLAKIESLEGEVNNPAEIPSVPDRLRAEGTVRRPVDFELFGQRIEIGAGDYEIPKLKIVEVVAHGTEPTAPARVVLEPEEDGLVPFTLVDGNG